MVLIFRATGRGRHCAKALPLVGTERCRVQAVPEGSILARVPSLPFELRMRRHRAKGSYTSRSWCELRLLCCMTQGTQSPTRSLIRPAALKTLPTEQRIFEVTLGGSQA